MIRNDLPQDIYIRRFCYRELLRIVLLYVFSRDYETLIKCIVGKIKKAGAYCDVSKLRKWGPYAMAKIPEVTYSLRDVKKCNQKKDGECQHLRFFRNCLCWFADCDIISHLCFMTFKFFRGFQSYTMLYLWYHGESVIWGYSDLLLLHHSRDHLICLQNTFGSSAIVEQRYLNTRGPTTAAHDVCTCSTITHLLTGGCPQAGTDHHPLAEDWFYADV